MSSFRPYRPGPRGLRIQIQDYVEDTRRKQDPEYDSLRRQYDDEARVHRRAATERVNRESDYRREQERQREEDRQIREFSSRFGSRRAVCKYLPTYIMSIHNNYWQPILTSS